MLSSWVSCARCLLSRLAIPAKPGGRSGTCTQCISFLGLAAYSQMHASTCRAVSVRASMLQGMIATVQLSLWINSQEYKVHRSAPLQHTSAFALIDMMYRCCATKNHSRSSNAWYSGCRGPLAPPPSFSPSPGASSLTWLRPSGCREDSGTVCPGCRKSAEASAGAVGAPELVSAPCSAALVAGCPAASPAPPDSMVVCRLLTRLLKGESCASLNLPCSQVIHKASQLITAGHDL
jgi:hypothetical protein